MSKVSRSSIVDYQTWIERRPAEQEAIAAVKAARRVVLARTVSGLGLAAPAVATLTFLFENHETVRWQVQEMMRIERIVREADIVHELATYNELIGGPGALGCTLLVGIPDEASRSVLLPLWRALSAFVYARCEDGSRAAAQWDPRQVGAHRLSSVQYLQFAVAAPVVAIGVDGAGAPEALAPLIGEVPLDPAQREALAADLAASNLSR